MKCIAPVESAAVDACRGVAMPSRRLGIFAAVTLTLCLTGCSTGSLFDSETPTPVNYILAPVPPAAAATSSAASNIDLAIARPDVAPGLDSRRVAVLRGRQLDYYRRTEWGGSVTEMVQTLLVASLDDQKLFRSVTSEQARVSSEYLLDVEVRDFQAEYAEGNSVPQIRVTFVGRLIRIADREIIGSVTATALRAATDNRMSEVAAAFEAAAQQVALEVAGKTAQSVNADQASATSPARARG
jgi:cholesterol transport system auxiliary component